MRNEADTTDVAGSPSPGSGSGRRGRRRVVAPPTSGQPEEVEAQPYVPAGSQGEPTGEEPHAGGDPEDDAAARERWFREQRPPHW